MTRLLAGLVDDAGLFPPTWLPMSEALARFRSSHHPILSGRFLCPASRLSELVPLLDAPIEVHLIADEAVELPAHPLVTVRAVELRSGVMTQIPCYVEGIPPAALAGKGVFGKLRCGGARIPPVEEVAAYLMAAAEVGLAFKATAGLHAAVRGWESTNGVPHHGYLNVLLAVARALTGGDVAQVLRGTDATALVEEARSLDAGTVDRTRAMFHSYGSCDTGRPVSDAVTLGLWAAAEASA